MFRQSKAKEISNFFTSPLKEGELTVFYLGVSGFIARTAKQTVLIDPAGMLKDNEVKTLQTINLILFTHDHLDHFSNGKTQTIFKMTNAPILAEAKVAKKLEGEIPTDKLISAEHGKTYVFGDLSATAIQGIHSGPIMLYQLKMDGITLFHGGDSGYVSL